MYPMSNSCTVDYSVMFQSGTEARGTIVSFGSK
jgi:hypothetical protein